MATFSTPAAKKKYAYEIEQFLGIDLSNAPNNVSINRSPYCPNMIRDTVGKVKKRDGYSLVRTYAAKINGVHFLGSKMLVHSGTKLYLDGETPTELFTMNNAFSSSFKMNDNLYILDGANYVVYDGTTASAVVGTIPLILISRTPTGGGTVYDAVNLLSAWRKVGYLGTSATLDYYLPSTSIDAATVTAQKDNGSGVFVDLVENTDFTVNRTTGKVTFSTAPGVPPVTGEDNVYITYSKTVSGYADKIKKADICILYGVNGTRNRVFVAGNPDNENVDYYCELSDPTYFSDLNYSVLGNGAIMNYSIVNETLVTHKIGEENGSNAVLREGTITDSGTVFATSGSYATSGALSKRSFAILENEPMFLTEDKNVSAITPSDVLGERLGQERSYYITTALKGENDLTPSYTDAVLAASYACAYNGFYFLAVYPDIYILDGTQFSLEKNRPYSTRQYECYYWKNINATILYENNGLCFGTSSGGLYQFIPGQSNDLTENAISCWWETPELDGESFADKKTFTYVGTRIASAPKTGVKISTKVTGLWGENTEDSSEAVYFGGWDDVVDYNAEASYFDFNNINFSEFSFSTDSSPHTLGRKIKIKNQDKVQFRFENSRINEPFGLYKAIIEYTESGKYRK